MRCVPAARLDPAIPCSDGQRDTIVQAVEEILQPDGVEALERIAGGLADYNEQVDVMA